MENDLIKKLITVSAIEMKAGPYGNIAKIKDQENLTYSVFEKKRDNTISAAWKNLPKIGETVQIAFVEEQKEYEGKPYTQRTIRVIDPDIGNGMANALAQQTPNSGANTASQSEYKPRNYAQEGYEKCLWNFFVGPKAGVSLTQSDCDLVWETFKLIEKDAKVRFFEFDKASAPTASEPLPVIEINECVVCGASGFNADDGLHECIPF